MSNPWIDVLLADEAGKALQPINRPQLNKVLANSTVSSQWGSGLHNGSTDVVHMYMNACKDIAEVKKLSAAIIFLDIKTAYASAACCGDDAIDVFRSRIHCALTRPTAMQLHRRCLK